MKNFFENIITFFLMVLITIISLATVYFCLDVFGIIQVPAEYSIASIFYSQIEVLANGETMVDEPDPVNKVVKKKDTSKQNAIEQNTVEPTNTEVYADPLEELNRLLAEQEQKNSNTPVEISNVNNFYYDQLDSYGKMIYELLYQNIDKLRTGTFTADYDTLFNDLLHEDF